MNTTLDIDVGRRLKEYNPAIRVIAAAPHPGDMVQGLRALEDGYIPPVFDDTVLDGRIVVDSATSFATTKELTHRTGIFAGISSGAVLRTAQKVAPRFERANIVLLLADSGWKYLSTGAYTADLDEAERSAEKIIYF